MIVSEVVDDLCKIDFDSTNSHSKKNAQKVLQIYEQKVLGNFNQMGNNKASIKKNINLQQPQIDKFFDQKPLFLYRKDIYGDPWNLTDYLKLDQFLDKPMQQVYQFQEQYKQQKQLLESQTIQNQFSYINGSIVDKHANLHQYFSQNPTATNQPPFFNVTSDLPNQNLQYMNSQEFEKNTIITEQQKQQFTDPQQKAVHMQQLIDNLGGIEDTIQKMEQSLQLNEMKSLCQEPAKNSSMQYHSFNYEDVVKQKNLSQNQPSQSDSVKKSLIKLNTSQSTPRSIYKNSLCYQSDRDFSKIVTIPTINLQNSKFLRQKKEQSLQRRVKFE